VLSFAQQAERLARIGVLSPFIGPDSAFFEALRGRLQELGYVEGRNAAYLYRVAEDYDGLARHAAEMVRLDVHVIVTAGAPGVRAAMRATKTVPIVIANVGDAVAQGFVASLARPGGNVTGLTSLNTELSVKRLDLLAEALPSIRHVIALREAVGDSGPVHATEEAARARGLKLEVMQVREADELPSAFAAMPAGRGTALCVIQGPLFTSQLRRLVELAAARNLPAMYPDSRYVEVGGLMSYGPNIRENYRQSAVYVDRILKGAAPATMPVEQPTVFELALNLKTARTLGVTLSRDVRTRADIVIE
jgi:putative ABC transport system substrate-binding protein